MLSRVGRVEGESELLAGVSGLGDGLVDGVADGLLVGVEVCWWDEPGRAVVDGDSPVAVVDLGVVR